MNPKNLSVRLDHTNGAFWLTEEKYQPGKPRLVKKLKDITEQVLLAFCADLYEIEGTRSVSRDVKFPSGATARITATETSADCPEKHFEVVCPKCDSRDVSVEAQAKWNPTIQAYEMSTYFDKKTCGNCGHTSYNMEHRLLNPAPQA